MASMDKDVCDGEKCQYCLLFWYHGERNWNIQSSLTIKRPRKDEYKVGELVTAKHTGKLYRAVVVGIKDRRELLWEEATRFEALLRDDSLSANEVLNKLGLSVDLSNTGNESKDPVSTSVSGPGDKLKRKTDKHSNGTKVLPGDDAVSRGPKKARLLVGSTKDAVPTAVIPVPGHVEPTGAKDAVPTAVLPVPGHVELTGAKDDAPTAVIPVPRHEERAEGKDAVPTAVLPVPHSGHDKELTGAKEERRKTSRPTCRHCRDKCRCSTISSLKARVEKLEKTAARVDKLENLLASSSALALPVSPPKPASSFLLQASPSSSPSPLASPSASASGLCRERASEESSQRDAPDVNTLLASLANVSETDVSGTIKKLALTAFTQEELCDCSLSGKRSAFTKETVRPPLNATVVSLIEQAASQHLSKPLDRKVFVDKFQNVQKHLRATRATRVKKLQN